MRHSTMSSSYYASPNQRSARRARTSCALDEANDAACLGVILGTIMSLTGISQTGWQWASLVGFPAC